MDRDKILKFLKAVRNDPGVTEKFKAMQQSEERDEGFRFYADIAAGLGYDITEADLKAFVESTAGSVTERTEDAASQIQELPDDALDRVAGGKKDHDECKNTYKDRENCWFNDGCDNVYYLYDHYVCDWYFYTCPNQPS